jgi:hypothetical protein
MLRKKGVPMSRSIYQIAGYEAYKAHCMTEALRYLHEHRNNDSHTDRDDDARTGLVYILEEISNKMRVVSRMMDVADAKDLAIEIDDPFRYVDGYPVDGIEDIRSLIKESKNSDKKVV